MQEQVAKGFIAYLLEFLYTVAHWLGERIVSLFHAIFPNTPIQVLADPIGMLAVITIIVFLAGVAKKVAWIIVSVGWGLIIIRIVMIILSGTQ